jgi:hypothetical protein
MKWNILNVYDSFPQYESCEWCGKEKIRWVHVMQNEKTLEIKNFGCVCADKVNETKFNSLLERFMKLKWKKNKRGISKEYQENSLFIFYKDGYYVNKINGLWGTIRYKTQDDAKLGIFKKLNNIR